MASFNKIMPIDEWMRLVEFNKQVLKETGSPIIDMNAMAVSVRAHRERAEIAEKEAEEALKAEAEGGSSSLST